MVKVGGEMPRSQGMNQGGFLSSVQEDYWADSHIQVMVVALSVKSCLVRVKT